MEEIPVKCLGNLETAEYYFEDDFPYYIRFKEIGGEKKIDIGVPEYVAHIIEIARQNALPPTDLQTYSMFHSILIGIGATVKKVVMTGIKNARLHGVVWIECDREAFAIPAEAINAIPLAITNSCPIFIRSSIFDDAEKLRVKLLGEWRLAELANMSKDNPQ